MLQSTSGLFRGRYHIGWWRVAVAGHRSAPGLLGWVNRVLHDPRDSDRVVHSQLSLLRQRIYGLCLGYEDLNDHQDLRLDPALQTAVNRDTPLASPANLCRLENRIKDATIGQACLRPRDRFWDIPVPKIDSAFDNLLVPQPSWSPSTTQQLRKLVAAPYLAPNDWTPRSEAYFVFPLAQGTPGKQCGLAATGVYQPSLRSPWLAAPVCQSDIHPCMVGQSISPAALLSGLRADGCYSPPGVQGHE
uniref:transposase n=10 Tax=Thiolapillus sp. TaxID=2017437 RepID=UPI0035A8FA90